MEPNPNEIVRKHRPEGPIEPLDPANDDPEALLQRLGFGDGTDEEQFHLPEAKG